MTENWFRANWWDSWMEVPRVVKMVDRVLAGDPVGDIPRSKTVPVKHLALCQMYANGVLSAPVITFKHKSGELDLMVSQGKIGLRRPSREHRPWIIEKDDFEDWLNPREDEINAYKMLMPEFFALLKAWGDESRTIRRVAERGS